MKNLSYTFISLLVLIALSGCPYESTVAPGYPGKEETRYFWFGGKYACKNPNYDIDSVLIEQADDYSYKVKVWAPMGSENYKGYYTKINGTELFYVAKKSSDGKTTYQAYILEGLKVFSNDSVVTYELSATAFKNDKFTTTEQFREIIKERLADGSAKSSKAVWREVF